MNEIYQESKKRQPSQREIILNILKVAGDNGILNTELTKVMLRYGQIVYLLRLDGYKIRTDNVGKGIVRYTLLSNEPEAKVSKKSGLDIVKEEWGTLSGYHLKQLEAMLEANNLQIIHRPNGLNKLAV